MIKITIFTPTYNRREKLKRCYNSLVNQTNKSFEWIIVDDGSVDNTDELVNLWITENKIDLKYFKQENSGKMIAHNKGVQNALGNIFVCLDSDDYLKENTVEEILKVWNEIDNSKCVGIVSLKIFENYKPVGTTMPNNLKYSTLMDLYTKYKFRGDTMLVYRTELLKKYLFPNVDGEKFIPEPYVYDQIDLEGPLYILNEGFYICEYLEDGYSANISKVIRKNPKSYTMFAKQRMDIVKGFYQKLKASSQYVLGCWLSCQKNILKNSNHKFITIISFPFAAIVYVKKYQNNHE